MGEKIKILVADDEERILNLTADFLAEAGYNIITAKDGKEALKMAREETPDLILLDIRMPKMTGFEVTKIIREDSNIGSTPIIIVSALGDEWSKITGFEEGADDYITKPVNMEELKTRIQAILFRSKGLPKREKEELQKIETGIPNLDKILSPGLPKGSNILLVGPIGKGKSTFVRKFIASGVKRGAKCMFVAIDDDPTLIKRHLEEELPYPVAEFEKLGLLRFVDAYSWSGGEASREKYSITGMLDLTQLSSVIADAGEELGQTVQVKGGGRRVIDSISSLLVNFELPSTQKFLSSIARTSLAFGGVTTLFTLEEGSIDDKTLNNIKYLMDGTIEFKIDEPFNKHLLRISNMKWVKYSKEWIEW